jgi:hypothetical protein
MEKEDIKVFFKNDRGTFRKILKKDEYSINKFGQIVLPKDHYSVDYVKRIVSGTKWEDFPQFETVEKVNEVIKNFNDNLNLNNDIDFFLDN